MVRCMENSLGTRWDLKWRSLVCPLSTGFYCPGRKYTNPLVFVSEITDEGVVVQTQDGGEYTCRDPKHFSDFLPVINGKAARNSLLRVIGEATEEWIAFWEELAPGLAIERQQYLSTKPAEPFKESA